MHLKESRVEVRIDTATKAAAQARALLEGHTLSEVLVAYLTRYAGGEDEALGHVHYERLLVLENITRELLLIVSRNAALSPEEESWIRPLTPLLAQIVAEKQRGREAAK